MTRFPNTQFIVRPEHVSRDEFVLVDDEARHAVVSLRVRAGAAIIATDGRGRRFEGVVVQAAPSRVRARMLRVLENVNEPGVRVTLCCGITRGGRMDQMVESAVEIGAARIVPVITERSQVSPKPGGARTDRWERIARAATKQSMRSWMAVIVPPMSMTDAVGLSAEHDVSLIATTHYGARPVREVIPDGASVSTIALLVGPEGGFTDGECDAARLHGWRFVSLGPRRLRSETAGVVLLSLVFGALGET